MLRARRNSWIIRGCIVIFSIPLMLFMQQMILEAALPNEVRKVRLPRHVRYYEASDFARDSSVLGDFNSSCLAFSNSGSNSSSASQVCVYPKDSDYISDHLRQDGHWEPDISQLLEAGVASATASAASAVFLDLGANLGVHSLHVASKGHTVVAVEPLKSNLVRLWHAASLTNIHKPAPLESLSGLRVLSNALGNSRWSVYMSTVKGNFGGTRVGAKISVGTPDAVPTVLLSDVIDEVANRAFEGDKVHFVIKLDIEGSECEALIGSRGSFDPNDLYDVVLIVMEWRFKELKKGNDNGQQACSEQDLRTMTSVLLAGSGFTPMSIDGQTRLNAEESHQWPIMDMVWIKEAWAQRIFKLAKTLQ